MTAVYITSYSLYGKSQNMFTSRRFYDVPKISATSMFQLLRIADHCVLTLLAQSTVLEGYIALIEVYHVRLELIFEVLAGLAHFDMIPEFYANRRKVSHARKVTPFCEIIFPITLSFMRVKELNNSVTTSSSLVALDATAEWVIESVDLETFLSAWSSTLASRINPTAMPIFLATHGDDE
jgi:hypothetical protein